MRSINSMDVSSPLPHAMEPEARQKAAPAAPSLPAFSVVIEWDNPLLSEADRSLQMLRELGCQIRALEKRLPAPPQVIFVYDSLKVDPQVIEQLIDQAGLRSISSAEVSTFAADGLAYYEQKNRGALAAAGDVIVFLDSDVIPQAGWLAGLLEAFQNPGVGVAGGSTFVAPLETLYDRAFALFWFFPVEQKPNGLRPAKHFFANNVAFRREVFEAHPFPRLPTFRGQCSALAENLRREGIGIFIQQRSAVSHPPPNGFGHFMARAICQGHDHVHRFTPERRANPLSFLRSAGRFARDVSRSAYRISKYRGDVGLGLAGAIPAFGLAVVYYALKLGGEWITLISPGFVPRRFRV